jgi:outer membrane lipoprotein-sorting protein
MEYVSPKDPDQIIKTVVLDGKYVWSYVPLLNEVNKQKIQNPDKREILPGTGASLEDLSKNWNMKLVPDEAANAKGVHLLQLTPKPDLLNRSQNKTQGREDVREQLEIWVKEGDWFPVQFGYVTLFEDGTRRSVIISLSNIQRDQKLPPTKFKFAVPKDAEVIDLSSD